MAQSTLSTTSSRLAQDREAALLQAATALFLRNGLVLVIAWIGAMKFTGYEAEAIKPFVANSPLMGWLYNFLGVQAFSNLLGIVEIGIACLLAARPVSPRAAGVGAVLAIGMFLTTLTFFFSTPGWEASLGGFPALSVVPGQFLLKDIVLLGAAIWCLADARSSM